MSYTIYSKENREAVVDLYFETTMSCREIIQELVLPVKQETYRYWIRNDPRYGTKRHGEKKQYSPRQTIGPQVKFQAIQMLRNGIRPCEIRDTLHLSSISLILSWKRKYNLQGVDALMPKKTSGPSLAAEAAEACSGSFQQQKDDSEFTAQEKEQLIFEIKCLQAENDLLKKSEGSAKKNNGSISNSGKSLMITSLSPEYRIRRLCRQFKIQRSSYYYCVAHPIVDNWAETDAEIEKFISKNEKHKTKSGHRKVTIGLEAENIFVPERRVRAVMKKHSWGLVQYKSMKPYHSYKNDGNPPVANWLYDSVTKKHFFKPAEIWEVLATDVSEIHVNGFKIFLSLIMDLHDSAIVSYRISRNPDTALMMGSLNDAIAKMPENACSILHSDQGSVYRGREWKRKCLSNHILQSMSRKGKSGDNAAMEGFFGRFKQEWFNHGDFSDMSYDDVVASMEEELLWYNEERTQSRLRLSPNQYRKAIGLLEAC
jgi:transposase InsO family protein/transposase